MTFRILFRPEVQTEILDAVVWYEAQGRGLGAEFLRAIDAVIASIERHPLSHPLVSGEVRRAIARRFPYSVMYEVANGKVLIIACFHGQRDPRNWQDRV